MRPGLMNPVKHSLNSGHLNLPRRPKSGEHRQGLGVQNPKAPLLQGGKIGLPRTARSHCQSRRRTTEKSWHFLVSVASTTDTSGKRPESIPVPSFQRSGPPVLGSRYRMPEFRPFRGIPSVSDRSASIFSKICRPCKPIVQIKPFPADDQNAILGLLGGGWDKRNGQGLSPYGISASFLAHMRLRGRTGARVWQMP